MDQEIVSDIENEKNNVSLAGDISTCCVDICSKFFINDAVTKHLAFSGIQCYTVEHSAASAKTKFLHKMCQKDFILVNTGNEWNSEEKL